MNKGENIGALRHRVTIRKYSTTQDTYGQESITWSTLATVWAAYEYRINTSDEEEMADKKTAVSIVRWTMRHRDDVEPKMRLTDEAGNLYDILSLTYDPSKTYMVAECQNVGLAGLIVGSPVPGSVDVMTRIYKEEFTNVSANAVTVTANDGVLSSLTDNILAFVDGQETDEFTVSGSVITFSFTVYSDDTIRIVFFP